MPTDGPHASDRRTRRLRSTDRSATATGHTRWDVDAEIAAIEAEDPHAFDEVERDLDARLAAEAASGT